MPRAPKRPKDRKTVWISELVRGKIKRVRKSVLVSELPPAPITAPEPEPEAEPEAKPGAEPDPARPQEADVSDLQQDLSGTTEELARLTVMLSWSL